jgi:hypothetical protein
MMVRKFGVAAATAVLLLTAACGGGGGRPSVSDLQKSLTDGKAADVLGTTKLTDAQAKCIAKLLADSGISDDGLQAIVDGKKGYKPSKDDEKESEKVAPKFASCAS